METRKSSILSILAMIIVLAVSAGCLFGCGNSDDDEKSGRKSKKSSPERVVKAYVEAIKKCDAKKIVDLMPKEVVESMAKGFGGSREGFIDKLQGWLDDKEDKHGYKWSKMKYELGEFEDLSERDFDEMKREAEELGMDIKEVKIVEIKMTIPLEDDEDEIWTEKLYVIKMKNSWYVVMDDM